MWDLSTIHRINSSDSTAFHVALRGNPTEYDETITTEEAEGIDAEDSAEESQREEAKRRRSLYGR